MAVNVLSWNAALKRGYEPRLYSYTAGDIPLGSVEAVLDFKIWAMKAMGIGCYFTEVHTGRKILLTVYYRKVGGYSLPGSKTDFSSCPTATIYRLFIWQNGHSGSIYFSLQ